MEFEDSKRSFKISDKFVVASANLIAAVAGFILILAISIAIIGCVATGHCTEVLKYLPDVTRYLMK